MRGILANSKSPIFDRTVVSNQSVYIAKNSNVTYQKMKYALGLSLKFYSKVHIENK